MLLQPLPTLSWSSINCNAQHESGLACPLEVQMVLGGWKQLANKLKQGRFRSAVLINRWIRTEEGHGQQSGLCCPGIPKRAGNPWGTVVNATKAVFVMGKSEKEAQKCSNCYRRRC